VRANIFRKLWIMTITISATLRITLIVLYRTSIKGGYPRSFGDKWLKWWAGRLVGAVRINYKVLDTCGLELEPGRRYIIMSNHRSHYDIPLMTLCLPGSIRMLTKKEFFKVPLWGRGLKAGEFMSIDRSDLEQAKKDLASARAKMESGVVLWIAPEGTRSRTGRLGPFKKGGFVMAIESGATIIPVGVKGTENVLRPKTTKFFLDQDVEIAIGSPIEAAGYSIDQRDLLLEDVREAIAQLCGEGEAVRVPEEDKECLVLS
jgi:1-acyl-sn-glycerol-3-phosphate acyltransferase